jgi:mono/diheme cytochrome c family protein
MLKFISVLPALFLFALAQQPVPAPAPTAIPAEAAKMVNPVTATSESQAKAKKVYGYDCALCHGVTGNGKGDMVETLNLKLKDLTDPSALSGMTDGELFYIIKNGKGQMPAEGDRAKTDDLWNMVILVRSFAKK